MKKLTPVLMLMVLLILAVFVLGGQKTVFAQETKVQVPSEWLGTLENGAVKSSGLGLESIKTQIIPAILSLLIFIITALSLIFTIIGGTMFIMAGGNKEGTAKAKATITYALVGLIMGLGSFIVLKLLGDFFGVNLVMI